MSGDKIVIRRTKNLSQIVKLNELKEFFPDAPLKTDELGVWFLAKIGRNVVGWAGYTISGGDAKILRTGVFKAYQNQGIKRRLVKAMERYAKKGGCKNMTSYCAYWNLASANSLIRSGYKLRPPKYVKHDGQWLCWTKPL